LPEVLRGFKDFRLAANGLILVLVILYLPKGIWDPRRIRGFLRRRQSPIKTDGSKDGSDAAV
jgi:branched-chain amino acid transport system permease protein